MKKVCKCGNMSTCPICHENDNGERSPVERGVMRNADYFDKLGREASIAKLAEHEQSGTLMKFIGEVAPDYINASGEVEMFCLITDLGW